MDENYGIEEAGFPSDDSSETVNISPAEFELSVVQYRHLTTTVNPLANSDNFGIDIRISISYALYRFYGSKLIFKNVYTWMHTHILEKRIFVQ